MKTDVADQKQLSDNATRSLIQAVREPVFTGTFLSAASIEMWRYDGLVEMNRRMLESAKLELDVYGSPFIIPDYE